MKSSRGPRGETNLNLSDIVELNILDPSAPLYVFELYVSLLCRLKTINESDAKLCAYLAEFCFGYFRQNRNDSKESVEKALTLMSDVFKNKLVTRLLLASQLSQFPLTRDSKREGVAESPDTLEDAKAAIVERYTRILSTRGKDYRIFEPFTSDLESESKNRSSARNFERPAFRYTAEQLTRFFEMKSDAGPEASSAGADSEMSDRGVTAIRSEQPEMKSGAGPEAPDSAGKTQSKSTHQIQKKPILERLAGLFRRSTQSPLNQT